jgi:hypothetical protein
MVFDQNPQTQLMMNNFTSSLPILGLLLLISCQLDAEWMKIDDFETDDIWEKWAMNANLTEMYDLAIVDRIPDPLDPDNQVLFVNSNAFETSLWDQTSLFNTSAPHIPDGTEATLYFRLFRRGTSDGYVIGFINGSTPDFTFDTVNDRRIIAEPQVGWTSYQAYMRPRDTSWEVYDTNGFRRVPDFTVVAGYWYEIWMHIMNRPGASGADEYAVYFRRSDEAEPTRLMIPSSDGGTLYETALFRNQIDFAITNFGMSHTMDSPADRNAGDPQYWDDFYMDTSGLNLTRPEGVTVPEGSLKLWNSLPIVETAEGDFVNTEEVLGWLGVDWDPYLWSSSMSSWTYVLEYRPFGSLWVYIWPRSDGLSPVPEPTHFDYYALVPELGRWAYIPEYSAQNAQWIYLY